MIQVTPQLYFGNVGEFGDANVLAAAGVELAFLCQPGPFPHAAVPSLAVLLDDGSPDWYVKGLAKLLNEVYGVKVLGLFDQSGGLTLGAFLAVCAAVEKLGGSFATRRAQLEGLVPDVAISAALVTQGERIYP